MSKYAISDELIAMAMNVRGKVHPWDVIPASRTALVVIDMQNYFVAPTSQGEAATARDIVPCINQLAAGMRENGGHVVWVQNTTSDTLEAWSVRHELQSAERARIRLDAMTLGASGFELWPALDTRPGDVRMVKRLYSAFVQGSSDLTAYLRERNIDFVLIAGTYTDCCSLASAQDAMMLNFRTIMVSDCNAGSSPQAHAAALDCFFRFFGDVLSSDEVIARLQGGENAKAA